MTTVAPTTAATFCATLVDEWARHGITEAVVCPGSRSTPLALALARHPGIRVTVRLDERGAGFFGVGIALASERPPVVLTTSGTAAAELHAAVLEAHHARVPLIVCTADRPPELHHVGAPQTIEQNGLFGGAVRWFVDPGVPDDAARETWRSLASRMVAEALSGPYGPGPVHVNLPFRDPLVGVASELPAPNRSGVTHFVGAEAAGSRFIEDVRDLLRPGREGVVIVGRAVGGGAVLARELAERLSWPLLADPRSGARDGSPNVVGAADALLRDEGFASRMLPEVVLRIGEPWASKVLSNWLARSAAEGAVHVGIDPHWAWRDPGRELSYLLRGVLDQGALPPAAAREGPFLRGWMDAEALAQEAIDSVIGSHAEVTEPGIARALYALSPPRGAIFASSSMPVRDLEWYARPRPEAPKVFANRGVNGIDGVVSSILGLAAASAGAGTAPVFGLVGDLAVLHDASALMRPVAGAPPMPAVIVVLDNAGGGIFSFLPQAAALEETEFEQLFGTPHEPGVAELVRACGYETAEISESKEFEPALARAIGQTTASSRPVFVVADTNRVLNVQLHNEIEEAVRRAISTAGLSQPFA